MPWCLCDVEQPNGKVGSEHHEIIIKAAFRIYLLCDTRLLWLLFISSYSAVAATPPSICVSQQEKRLGIFAWKN